MVTNQEKIEEDCPDWVKKKLRDKYNGLSNISFVKYFLDKEYKEMWTIREKSRINMQENRIVQEQ